MSILTTKSAKRLRGVSAERFQVGAVGASGENQYVGWTKQIPATAEICVSTYMAHTAERSQMRPAKRLHLEAMMALYIIVFVFTWLTGFTAVTWISAFTGFTEFTGSEGLTGFEERIGFTGACAYAKDLSGPEYQVKAAFIYNFAKFVEWPQSAFDHDNNFIILSIAPNNEPNSDVFLSLNNKTVGGKKIKVRICDDIKSVGGDCHILFLDSADPKFIQDVLKTVKDRSVLTVGHSNGFIQEGGIINFFIKEGKLRFEVNLDAARRSGIKLGSQILMSAEIIIDMEEHK